MPEHTTPAALPSTAGEGQGEEDAVELVAEALENLASDGEAHHLDRVSVAVCYLRNLAAALRAAPVRHQEPVAYLVEGLIRGAEERHRTLVWGLNTARMQALHHPDLTITPLYASPPPQAAPGGRERALEDALRAVTGELRNLRPGLNRPHLHRGVQREKVDDALRMADLVLSRAPTPEAAGAPPATQEDSDV